jgi:aspartate racemase
VHIGLIGGIGPAATEFYYRGLVARHASAATPLQLTIVHADSRELARNAANGDTQRQAEVFLCFVRRLAAAGAEAAAITSMGGHFCADELAAISPIPILNAIPEISAEISRRGIRTLGILGTRGVMQTRLYGGISTANIVAPEGEALEQTHRNYLAMAGSGRVTDTQRQELFSVGQQLCQAQGAEAVLLAGTDLFLAFDGRDCGFPVIDCADIHIRALHQASMRDAVE